MLKIKFILDDFLAVIYIIIANIYIINNMYDLLRFFN